MYEAKTFESIMESMMNNVIQKNSNIDTREGSIIWTALAPAAVELANAYIELNTVLDETFADTASREMLIKRAAERGLKPKEATKAILKGEFTPATVDLKLGQRFNHEALNYVITEKIANGQYKLQCEEAGTKGNDSIGTLVPIDYVEGLETASLTQLLIPGEDDEDTEVFRKRYFASLESESFGGNVTDYKEKTKSLQGVGGVKVFPAWNGGGTVKLLVVNSDFGIPSTELINSIQTEIDPVQNSGKGYGIAPIGHTVTVQGVTKTIINITTNITYEVGYNWQAVKLAVEQAMDKHFVNLTKTWEDSSNVIVRISQIESLLLGVQGIIDVTGTMLNGAASNVTVDYDKIPVRGTVNG